MASYAPIKNLQHLFHYDYFFNDDGSNKPHRGGFATAIEEAAKHFKNAYGCADASNQACMSVAFGPALHGFLSFCYNSLPQDVSNGVVALMLLGNSPQTLLDLLEAPCN